MKRAEKKKGIRGWKHCYHHQVVSHHFDEFGSISRCSLREEALDLRLVLSTINLDIFLSPWDQCELLDQSFDRWRRKNKTLAEARHELTIRHSKVTHRCHCFHSSTITMTQTISSPDYSAQGYKEILVTLEGSIATILINRAK